MLEGEPERIDGDAFLASCRKAIAEDFLKVISPHWVKEEVEFWEHGDLSDLAEGIKCAENKSLERAMTCFETAVHTAEGKPELQPEPYGYALFDLGQAHLYFPGGDINKAINCYNKAYELIHDPYILKMIDRAKSRKVEVRKLERKEGQAPQT